MIRVVRFINIGGLQIKAVGTFDWCVFFGIFIAYFIPNQIQIFAPHQVPATFIDDIVPITPGWIWIYVVYYFFIAGAFFASVTPVNHVRYITSITIATLASGIIFLLFPTSIPRELYPVSFEPTWSVWMLDGIRAADRSVNCLPSMHVTLSCIAAVAYWRASKKWGWLGVVGALLIVISTIATKQHYFLDAVGGGILATLAVLAADRWPQLLNLKVN